MGKKKGGKKNKQVEEDWPEDLLGPDPSKKARKAREDDPARHQETGRNGHFTPLRCRRPPPPRHTPSLSARPAGTEDRGHHSTGQAAGRALHRHAQGRARA